MRYAGSELAGSRLRQHGLAAAGRVGLRRDAEPEVQLDALAPGNGMASVVTGSSAAVFSSHCIERLYLDPAVPAQHKWRWRMRPTHVGHCFDLWLIASVQPRSEAEIHAWAQNISCVDFCLGEPGMKFTHEIDE